MDPVKQVYLARQRDLVRGLKDYKVPSQRIRASELAFCKRRTYYRLAGYVPALNEDGMTSARLNDYGDVGNTLHDDTRQWLVDGGAKIKGIDFSNGQEETESHVLDVKHSEEEFQISMRLDGLIKISNIWHVLEIKTLGISKFRPIRECWQNTKSEAVVLGYISEHHKGFIYQTHACMVGAKLKRAYVVLVDRNDCARGLHSFNDAEAIIGGPIVRFDKNVWKIVLNRCAAITRAVRNEIPPRAEMLPSSADCKQCPYWHLCHGADRRRNSGAYPAMLHPQLGEKIHVDDLK